MKWEYLTVTIFKVGTLTIIDADGNPQSGKLAGQIENLQNRQQVLDLIGEHSWELVSVNSFDENALMYTFKKQVS